AAPLAIDWNANLYYPHVGGGLQHNRVIREAEIGQPWNADSLSLEVGANWGSSTETRFSGFSQSSRAETSFLASDGTMWTRVVTGALWSAHRTGVIDWDLYIARDGEERLYIGSWGHSAHSGREMGEFQRANGAPVRESQQILRVWGTGSFATIILPYRKGETPVRTVTQEDCGVRISEANRTLCFAEGSYQFSDGKRKILTTFDSDPAQFAGIALTGGPTELVLMDDEVKISASGAPGVRFITLPGSWVAPPGLSTD